MTRPRAPRTSAGSYAASIVFGAAASIAGGCGHPPARPQSTAALAPIALPVTAAGSCTVRAVALDAGGDLVAAFGHRGAITIGGGGAAATAIPDAGGATASVAAIRSGGAIAWTWSAAAAPGPVALAGDRVVAVVAASGALELGGSRTLAVRGTPGAVAVGLRAADGAVAWTQALGATEWVNVSASAALPGGDVALAGAFAGTLRIGGQVVTSAGSSDGFVARLGGDGAVRWLIRVGGAGADGVTGVAAAGGGGAAAGPGAADRLAIAGTFTGEVDLRGVPLVPVAADSPFADGFVALLGGDGSVAWARTFGSKADDQVAGVAVTGSGRIAIAGTAREVTFLGAGGAAVTAGGVEEWSGHGAGDAMVAVWSATGAPAGSELIGGADYDGARVIAARGDELVVGGWFSGTIEAGGVSMHAGGGDDAFVAVLDDGAHVTRATALTGDGREDLSALAAVPTGWVAGLAFTAGAAIDGARFASPADPGGGCAIVVRPR